MQLRSLLNLAARGATRFLPQAVHARLTAFFRHTGLTVFVLLSLWLYVLWWGERTVYSVSAADCDWQTWETWPSGAQPHHVLIVADPQLVDPHTYPGRPWLLSVLTVWITDLYIHRNYNALLKQLRPDTTLFLGDLFDGGREWATGDYTSPDKAFKRFGTTFWLKEYDRFMDMFVDSWHRHGLHRLPSNEGRRIITSVPGNHDLGFAGGINTQVRDRFDAHFGPMNRIDVIGNHTVVSIDAVSLSAMNKADPETGSSGKGDGASTTTKMQQIWKPVETFLENAKSERSKAVTRRYQDLNVHRSDVAHEKDAQIPSSLFPTILFSHVPLFRDADTACGPMREHGASITLGQGYQYQNVLDPQVSSDIVKHLDAKEMAMIYSGDDHDYCEIEHNEFTGRIREITVKSISMAMGVLRPGVQLASLWNPIDMDNAERGHTPASIPRDTIQNHLCLLPFQAGIFIYYAKLFALTTLVLLVRAVRYRPDEPQLRSTLASEHDKKASLLPISQPPATSGTPLHSMTNSNASSASSTLARARGNGRLGGYGLSFSPRSASPSRPGYESVKGDADISGDLSNSIYRSSHRPSAASRAATTPLLHLVSTSVAFFAQRRPTKRGEFFRSLFVVSAPAFAFYFFLIWDESLRYAGGHD